MEDRSPSRSPPQSSPGDPLFCISPMSQRRTTASRPSPPPPPPAPLPSLPISLPPSTSSTGGVHRGESPLKRPRLSLSQEPSESSLTGGRKEEGGELGYEGQGNDDDEANDNSDVVPTSDTEEQELMNVETRWEQAARRESAWDGRMKAGAGARRGELEGRSSSLQEGTEPLVLAPRARSPPHPASTHLPCPPEPPPFSAAPGFPSPSSSQMSPTSLVQSLARPSASQLSTSRTSEQQSTSMHTLASTFQTAANFLALLPRRSPSPPRNAVAGPSRLPGFQPPPDLLEQGGSGHLADAPAPPLPSEAGNERSTERINKSTGGDASMAVNGEQRAAVGEAPIVFDDEIDYSYGDPELPYYPCSPQQLLSQTSPLRSRNPSRSRSTTPRPGDSSLPFVGTSSTNQDRDPHSLFPSLSLSQHHHPHHSQPLSPQLNSPASGPSRNATTPPPHRLGFESFPPPPSAHLSSILSPALTPPLVAGLPSAILSSILSQPNDDQPQNEVPPEDGAQPNGFAPQRVFRNRTSLQLNPYTRERAQYQILLARGGNKLAIVNAREEAEAVRRANGGGAVAEGVDSSLLGGWLVQEEAEKRRKEKGKGRAVEEEQSFSSGSDVVEAEKEKKRKELSREELERAFGPGVGGLLSSDSEEEALEVGPLRLGKIKKKTKKDLVEKEKEKELKRKRLKIKKPKKFPAVELLGGGVEEDPEGVPNPPRARPKARTYTRRRSASPRRPLADDRSPPPPSAQRDGYPLPNRAFDDYPPDNFVNGASPSPPRAVSPAHPRRVRSPSSAPSPPGQGRQLSRRSFNSSLSNSDADSDASSSSVDKPALDKKRQRMLGRMMPAVAANQLKQNLAMERQTKVARRKAERAARRASGAPIKAGQSVVRRGNGSTVAKPRAIIDVDSESDLDASEPEVLEDQAFYQRLDARRDGMGSLDARAVERAVQARYANAGGFESISEEEMTSEGERMWEIKEESEEEEFADADIRDWLVPLERGVAPRPWGGIAFGGGRNVLGGAAGSVFGGAKSSAGGRAPSVVDQMLSRTAASSRARVGGEGVRRRVGGGARGGGGGGGARRSQQQQQGQHRPSPVGGSSAQNRTGGATVGSCDRNGVVQLGPQKPVKPKPKPARHRSRNSGPPRPPGLKRPPPIVLDDDSIFGGDFDSPEAQQDENANRCPRPLVKRFLPTPRPAARGVRQPAPPPIPFQPRHVNGQVNPIISSGSPPAPAAALSCQSPRQQQQQQPLPSVSPAPLRQAPIGGVPWTSYGKFSLDFDISPLRTGVSFPSETGISNGRLLELVSLVQPSDDSPALPLPQACSVFGLQFAPEMSRAEFTLAFELVKGRLFEILEKARALPDVGGGGGELGEVEGEVEARDAMRFTCLFVSQQVADDDFLDVLKPAIQGLLDLLFGQLEGFSAPTSSKRAAETRIFFSLHAFAVELSIRFDILEGLEPALQAAPAFVVLLIRRLLEHGFNRTVKSLKLAQTDASSLKIQDFTAEVWVGLIQLMSALDARAARQGPSSLWDHLADALEGSGFHHNNLLAAEQIWYLVYGLTSLSQLSTLGNSRPTPTLSSAWSLVSKAVASVRLEADPVTDKVAPSSALLKRDQYIWTVIVRIHLLVVRWEWKLEEQGPLLTYLVEKVFKTRKFIKLNSDPTSDFPLFIRESNRELLLEVNEESDSAYDVFLKILALAVRDIRASAYDGRRTTERQAERSISRLITISTPIGKTPFTRLAPPTMTELSMLINRYTFTLLSVILDPSSTNALHALRQMRFYLIFVDADFKSRKICIRAMMYMAVLLHQHGLDLAGIVEWFGEMMETLLKEAAALDKPSPPPRLTTNGSERRGVEASTTPKNEIVWSMLMLLGSIRKMILVPASKDFEEAQKPAYPDPILLHPSWTQGILTSPLASDPRIGLEVIKCVQSFLDARQDYLVTTCPVGVPQPNGESQDEYGAEFDRIDLDDPDLRALLDGADAAVSAPQPNEEDGSKRKTGEMEKMFAGAVKDWISPAIYKLLSNLLAAGAEGGVIGKEKEAYVDQLVDCWAGCACVLVQQGDQDWTSYLELGPESWKRIGNSAAKRQVGIRFLYNVGMLDPSAYESLKEHYLPIFFQAIAVPSSRLTIEPEFVSLVLNLDALGDVFADLPLEKDEATGRFVLVLELFEVKRVDILSELFANIYLELNRIATGNPILQQRKAFLMACVQEMLATMIDHLETLSGPARAQYIALCLAVREAMQERAGLALNENVLRELRFFIGLR